MRSGRLLATLCLLLATPAIAAPPVLGQATTVVPGTTDTADQLDPGGADGGVSADDLSGLGATGTDPGAAAAPDDAPSLDGIAPSTPVTTTPADGTVAAGGTPGPPPYLEPGQDAAIQPVSSVSRLTEPDVPLEPLRIAALVAVLLAALALAIAALLRSLGVRTAAVDPVDAVTPASGGVRERTRNLADDVRDFLRHSR